MRLRSLLCLGIAALNPYIQSARLNGRALAQPLITYQQIESGGKLEFVMGPKPSRWASGWVPQP